jgi:hypothetical protein
MLRDPHNNYDKDKGRDKEARSYITKSYLSLLVRLGRTPKPHTTNSRQTPLNILAPAPFNCPQVGSGTLGDVKDDWGLASAITRGW